MRKSAFCKCEYKGTDQLRGYHAADQRLYFRCIDRIMSLLPKSEIPNLLTSSVAIEPRLYRAWSETPKTGFPMKRLMECLEYKHRPK